MVITKNYLNEIILEEIQKAKQEILAENFITDLTSKISNSKLGQLVTKSKDFISKKIISKFNRPPTQEETEKAEKIYNDYMWYRYKLGDKPEKSANLFNKLVKGVTGLTVLLAAAFIYSEIGHAVNKDKSLASALQDEAIAAYKGGNEYDKMDIEDLESEILNLKKMGSSKVLYTKRGQKPFKIEPDDPEVAKKLRAAQGALSRKISGGKEADPSQGTTHKLSKFDKWKVDRGMN